MSFDYIIIGAGIYGLYAANMLAKMGRKALIIDHDEGPFMRGSYINQARLHNGYHYPRSVSTAMKSAHYFARFMEDYGDCVHTDFTQIYAIAKDYSWTSGSQFQKFSDDLSLQCEEIDCRKYFNKSTVEKSFITHEYTFDAKLLSEKLYRQALKLGVEFSFSKDIASINKKAERFIFVLEDGSSYEALNVLNASYSGTNQIHEMLGYEKLNIKYELCEVILCNVSENIKKVGLTVMDGPFFSLMPFGKTGYHSITTVSRTPHVTSYDLLPKFSCQNATSQCTTYNTKNCNTCDFRPKSAFVEMWQTAKKYLKDDIEIEYVKSLFTLKPILKASEIDDSRPTVIRQYSESPNFYTVFSGKINTMYDLDMILLENDACK